MFETAINHTFIWVYMGIAFVSAGVAVSLGIYAHELKRKCDAYRRVLQRHWEEEYDDAEERWGR